jgi:hypothetical protein
MMVGRIRCFRTFAAGVMSLILIVLSSSAAWAAGDPSSSATPTITPSPTPSPTVTPTPTPAPLLNVSGGGALWFIGVIVAVVTLLGVGAVAVDARRASKWRDTVTAGISEGKYPGANPEKLLALIREPRGARGLTRGLIALLIIVLAALALAVTMISAAPDSSDLRKTIVTALLTVLASIAGFYFGARTAQTMANDATAAAAAAAQASPAHSPKPVITTLRNNKGTSGNPIEIIGSGLKEAIAVLFGSAPASSMTINDDSRVTVTPPAQPAGSTGTVTVIVVTPTDRSAAGPEAEFTYE